MALAASRQLDRVARRFALLGEPSRLALLDLLHERGEMSVQALCDASGQSQANTSKHLRLLLGEGLVARRKEGPYAYYSIADPLLAALCVLVCEAVERAPSVPGAAVAEGGGAGR